MALKALVDAGHQIVAVYSQPPRPAGQWALRCANPRSSCFAEAHAAFRCCTPPSAEDGRRRRRSSPRSDADIAVVAAYGLILPQAILDAPRCGCLNIHASLLPRWRGAAPIQRAILAGDTETGISIMQMDAGLDTGAVLLERRIAIGPTETPAASCTTAWRRLGGAAMVEALAGTLTPTQQPGEGVTYAAKTHPKKRGSIGTARRRSWSARCAPSIRCPGDQDQRCPTASG